MSAMSTAERVIAGLGLGLGIVVIVAMLVAAWLVMSGDDLGDME